MSRDRGAGSGTQARHVTFYSHPDSWSGPPEPSSASARRPDQRVVATALGSLLARAMGAELMLIAVHEEPLLPVDLPGAMSWTAIEEQARTVLAETRDSLAPHARIIVQADVLVWRGLRHVVRHEHRDLLVVGSAQDAHQGRVQLGQTADELLGAPRVSPCDRTVELPAARHRETRSGRRWI